MDTRIEQLIVAGRLHEDIRAAANARLAEPFVRERRARPRRRFAPAGPMTPRRAR